VSRNMEKDLAAKNVIVNTRAIGVRDICTGVPIALQEFANERAGELASRAFASSCENRDYYCS